MLSPSTTRSSATSQPALGISAMRVALDRDHADRSGRSPDRALLERIAQGNQAALRALFGRHRLRVFRYILRLIRDEDAAEDVLVDTFFEVWRSADRFAGRCAVSTWLLAIARHKALTALGRPVFVELDAEKAAEIPDLADDPEQVLQSKDLSGILRSCLASLSGKHTEVIDLIYYHEKTIAEVAHILALPEATVKTRMFYARRKLAELVRSELQEDAA